jgi:hypothetical protein
MRAPSKDHRDYLTPGRPLPRWLAWPTKDTPWWLDLVFAAVWAALAIAYFARDGLTSLGGVAAAVVALASTLNAWRRRRRELEPS